MFKPISSKMRNPGLLVALLLTGLLLLIPEGCFLVSRDVRADDVRSAFANVAEVPALKLRQEKIVNFKFITPEGNAWRRIRGSWGDPSYEVALVSSTGQYQYCLDGVTVTARQNDEPLSLESAGWIYGFSSDDSVPRECKSVGRSLRARPGSTVEVSLEAPSQFGDGTMFIVQPVWPYTKDKLVGVDLDQEFSPIVKGLAILGLLLTVGAALVLRSRYKLRPSRIDNKTA